MDDILIVEDDRALSQGIRLGLEGEGRRFIQTSTLDQGERALEERPFSLVVLDLNLPDGSGLELLRRLRDKFFITTHCFPSHCPERIRLPLRGRDFLKPG